MDKIRVTFTDGREMVVEPGVTFTGTDFETNAEYEYVCFTDHRTTGPFFAKRHYIYYFKVDPSSGRIVFSDKDSDEEYGFVVETLAEALDCAKSGPLCLFELERGGIKSVQLR